MAIYEFLCPAKKCPHHTERFEVRLNMADRDLACVRCPKCNAQCRRCEVPSVAPVAYIMEKGEVYSGNVKASSSTRGQRR